MQQPAKTSRHPKGLYVLFATEMWERFNYYGMRAILILFMTKALLWNDEFSSNLYGSYLGLIYLTPLVGGFMADRYWGNKRSIIVGGIVMAIGEFILFCCGSLYDNNPGVSHFLFFTGLGFMIAGNGFFKPNISSLVGQLYPQGDRRKDAAYTIFYMGINVGAGIGPLVCGTFGDTGNPHDFKWAFLIGGIGMILSVLVQLFFHNKYVLSPEGKVLGLTPTQEQNTGTGSTQTYSNAVLNSIKPLAMVFGMLVFATIMVGLMYLDTQWNYLPYLLLAATLFIVFFIFSDKTLTGVEKQRIGVIFIVSFFVVFFWAAYEQTGASLTFFADRQTDRQLWPGYTMPTSYFQSFNSAFLILLAPVLAWLWLKMGRREPSTPTKMALGLLLLASGYLWIGWGVSNASSGQRVGMIWLTGMYLLHTLGELCLSPIGLSLVNKLAPIKFASLLMAVWFLANAAGNKLAGVLGSLYPDKGRHTSFLGYQMNNVYDFFILFVIMGGLAGIILLLLSKKLRKMMHGIH